MKLFKKWKYWKNDNIEKMKTLKNTNIEEMAFFEINKFW